MRQMRRDVGSAAGRTPLQRKQPHARGRAWAILEKTNGLDLCRFGPRNRVRGAWHAKEAVGAFGERCSGRLWFDARALAENRALPCDIRDNCDTDGNFSKFTVKCQ